MNAHELGRTMSLWTVVPFLGLLLSIAFLPLKAPHFWESHKNKALVAFLWSLLIAVYFLFNAPHELVLSMKDYASFLILLTALFIISGGIVIKGDLKATPEVNSLFLLVGAVLANFIGTTGASMLLIRPLLKTNSERKHTLHIPIFFIFVVSNIGGLLTPLGDPPLFMGSSRVCPSSGPCASCRCGRSWSAVSLPSSTSSTAFATARRNAGTSSATGAGSFPCT